MDQDRAEATSRQSGTIVGLALLSLGVHVAVNALGGYGWFRDELYYVACSGTSPRGTWTSRRCRSS